MGINETLQKPAIKLNELIDKHPVTGIIPIVVFGLGVIGLFAGTVYAAQNKYKDKSLGENQIFNQYDVNRNGVLERDEVENLLRNYTPKVEQKTELISGTRRNFQSFLKTLLR